MPLSTASRARTSSPRLWSWVAVASSARGQSARRALHAAMEGVGIEGEGGGIEADIVARQQAAVAIEAGVLDRLGGDRRAELLEARHGAGAIALGEPAQHADRSPSGRSRGRCGARRRRRGRARRDRRPRARRRGRRCDRPGNAPAARPARGAAVGRASSPPAKAAAQASSWAPKLRARISRRAGSSSAAKSAGRPLSADQASASTRSPAASCCRALTSSMKS